jgi:hypothetical protein
MTFVTLISFDPLVLSPLPSAHKKLKCAPENQRQNDNNSPGEHTATICVGSMNNWDSDYGSQNDANQKKTWTRAR